MQVGKETPLPVTATSLGLKEVGVGVLYLKRKVFVEQGSTQQHLPCLLNPCFLHLGCAAGINLCCTIPSVQPRLEQFASHASELCSLYVFIFL